MPGSPLTTNSTYAFFNGVNPIVVTGNGPVCGGSTQCTATIRGTMAGNGGNVLAMAYTFGNGATATRVDGAAVFAKVP